MIQNQVLKSSNILNKKDRYISGLYQWTVSMDFQVNQLKTSSKLFQTKFSNNQVNENFEIASNKIE